MQQRVQADAARIAAQGGERVGGIFRGVILDRRIAQQRIESGARGVGEAVIDADEQIRFKRMQLRSQHAFKTL